jgi:hypothetical protein
MPLYSEFYQIWFEITRKKAGSFILTALYCVLKVYMVTIGARCQPVDADYRNAF